MLTGIASINGLIQESRHCPEELDEEQVLLLEALLLELEEDGIRPDDEDELLGAGVLDEELLDGELLLKEELGMLVVPPQLAGS